MARDSYIYPSFIQAAPDRVTKPFGYAMSVRIITIDNIHVKLRKIVGRPKEIEARYPNNRLLFRFDDPIIPQGNITGNILDKVVLADFQVEVEQGFLNSIKGWIVFYFGRFPVNKATRHNPNSPEEDNVNGD
ncbi:hypothetical protein DF947_10595 [Pedobacter paludis]|uniref:Uncharacterized protein n=1 Tax=Pedobacter paludis TaxID=2203212 RepID=A0A317F2Z4_9SPHI|nr:hypothetical protein DF947_10595 [Pedobacter paludis]